MLAVIDTATGNIQSVVNALTRIGVTAEIAVEAATLSNADAIVLPGVGAIAPAIKLLRERGFDEAIRRRVLDDMHENGVHDYLKFIKFGYGRCTDHASKDIRSGEMSREEAVELVRRHDSVKPKDLERWLDYVGMTEDEFDRIADTFRDPRVWAFRDGEWAKSNLWDQA